MTTTKQRDDENNKDNGNNTVQNYGVMKLRPAAARCLQPKKDYKYVPDYDSYDTLFSIYVHILLLEDKNEFCITFSHKKLCIFCIC